MKRSRKMYEKRMEEQLIKINEQILNDSLTNSLLQRAGELPDYYKSWFEESRLVAVIPALDLDDKKSESYFSVGSLLNEHEQKIRISPVFMITNDFVDISLGK